MKHCRPHNNNNNNNNKVISLRFFPRRRQPTTTMTTTTKEPTLVIGSTTLLLWATVLFSLGFTMGFYQILVSNPQCLQNTNTGTIESGDKAVVFDFGKS